jgi:hypothetical protein
MIATFLNSLRKYRTIEIYKFSTRHAYTFPVINQTCCKTQAGKRTPFTFYGDNNALYLRYNVELLALGHGMHNTNCC